MAIVPCFAASGSRQLSLGSAQPANAAVPAEPNRDSFKRSGARASCTLLHRRLPRLVTYRIRLHDPPPKWMAWIAS